MSFPLGRRLAAPLLVPLVLVSSAGAGLVTGAALGRLSDRPTPQAQPLGPIATRTTPAASSPSSAARLPKVQTVAVTSVPSRSARPVATTARAKNPSPAAARQDSANKDKAEGNDKGNGKGKGKGDKHGKSGKGDKGAKDGKGDGGHGSHGDAHVKGHSGKSDGGSHEKGSSGGHDPASHGKQGKQGKR